MDTEAGRLVENADTVSLSSLPSQVCNNVMVSKYPLLWLHMLVDPGRRGGGGALWDRPQAHGKVGARQLGNDGTWMGPFVNRHCQGLLRLFSGLRQV